MPVADDEDDIRSLVSFRLKRAGYEVITAADGEEALLLATTRLPDLVVLDMMMPKATGLEVTRSHVARGFDAGADDYVKKPFRPKDLQVRCSSGLRRVRLRRIGAGGEVSTSPVARAPRCR